MGFFTFSHLADKRKSENTHTRRNLGFSDLAKDTLHVDATNLVIGRRATLQLHHEPQTHPLDRVSSYLPPVKLS